MPGFSSLFVVCDASTSLSVFSKGLMITISLLAAETLLHCNAVFWVLLSHLIASNGTFELIFILFVFLTNSGVTPVKEQSVQITNGHQIPGYKFEYFLLL